MPRYIDADKLNIKKATMWFDDPNDRRSVERMIREAPTADVVPVVHGRWICIRKGYGEYECSVCHGADSNCSDYYGTHFVTEQEFCPNCGAKMDADTQEREGV